MFSGELKKDFAIDLISILKTVSGKIEEVTMHISPTGMQLHGMNESKCVALIANLAKDDIFTTFDGSKIKTEDVFNMKADMLKNILTRLKVEDIKVDYNNSDLVLSNIKGKFVIPVLEAGEDAKFKQPNLLYNTEFSISVPLLFEKFESGNIIGANDFYVEMKGGKFSIDTGGEGRTQKYSCEFPSESIVLTEGKTTDAISRYSYEFLSIMKLPFDFVDVKFNKDYPITLEYKYEGSSIISMFLAPVVKND